MAIQLRRGKFSDFDPSKMLPAEMAVVLSGDPAASTGRSVYVCFGYGVVKRIATYEDFQTELQAATEEVQEAFTEDVQTAISNAIAATNAANTAQQAAHQAAEAANAAAEAARAYVLGDISEKTVSYDQAEDRTIIESGESTATLFGKIKKWLSDLKNAAFCDVANNLTTTKDGSVLDARQGKSLSDKVGNLSDLRTSEKGSLVGAVNELNTDISKKVNFYAADTAGLVGVNLYFNVATIAYYPALIVFGNTIISVSIRGTDVTETLSNTGLTKTILHDGGDNLAMAVAKEDNTIRLKVITTNPVATYPVLVISLRQGYGVIRHVAISK